MPRTCGGERGRQEEARGRAAGRAGVAAGPEPGRRAARPRGDRRGAAGPGTGRRRLDRGRERAGAAAAHAGRAGRARAAARRLLAPGPHGRARVAPRCDPSRGKGVRLQAVPGRGGRALYAGALKAAGARAFVDAAPGAVFRYRNAPLRRMTPDELATVVEPGRVYDYGLLGAER